MKHAANEKVIVFCFPPNTTHLTQPLDKGVFGPLKTCWNQECQSYMSANPCKVVTQYSFMDIFSKAWSCAMTIPNIVSAFRTTGVFPFNRCAIKVSNPIHLATESLTKKTGLALYPFV